MSDRDVIEAQALRRRQVVAAFLRGDQGRARTPEGPGLRALLVGLALAVAVAVVVGIAGLVDASRHRHRQGDVPPALVANVSPPPPAAGSG
jgi:hypothetical protein